MGSLLYGNSGTEIGFDDRALVHLQVVITAKLRRREGFLFTWTSSAEAGTGRSSIWFDQSSAIVYRYAGSRAPTLNRAWIEALMLSANSAGGLQFSSEPIAEGPSPDSTAK
ncbi:ATP-dependent DNA ligase [Glaciihabitans sp. INWT7]|uniref:DUF7882 family protein n=1 Tax=Glaciihabitans sp. INWT7 TaxID=2596912 RepID=UPI0016272D8A|nr:ATP-dependent DNA ligase [Glaciihabitans sp. INWT7]QNE46853.1 ATP-dependent DNA ligase [Glaciihabitans sp. INWT7]